uniref:TBC1 domain family member 21 n=1 Tax=Salvator merianae TaxID=96440 RepID=A0A8D0BVW3_SALMN
NASLSPQQALGVKKLPIDSAEWQSYFDESGQLLKSRDYIASQILDRGLDPSVRSEAWKFLTGYYAWRSSHDERLAVDSMRRKSYEALNSMCEKIQPLLETEHRDFIEVQNLIKYQQGFHEMLLLFHLLVEKEYEIYWLFQFFLQKTENSCIMNIGVEKNLIMLKALIAFLDPVFARHLGKLCLVQSLFPWFCLFFQRVFRSFDDVWRLWEVFLTGLPCRNFQVIIAYTMLNMVRDQILSEDLNGDDILMLCNHIVDLDADTLIIRACSIYDQLLQQKNEVKNSVAFLY